MLEPAVTVNVRCLLPGTEVDPVRPVLTMSVSQFVSSQRGGYQQQQHQFVPAVPRLVHNIRKPPISSWCLGVVVNRTGLGHVGDTRFSLLVCCSLLQVFLPTTSSAFSRSPPRFFERFQSKRTRQQLVSLIGVFVPEFGLPGRYKTCLLP